MLVELNLVEQRYKAVLEVLDGATVTDVAKRNGVSRQTMDACSGIQNVGPQNSSSSNYFGDVGATISSNIGNPNDLQVIYNNCEAVAGCLSIDTCTAAIDDYNSLIQSVFYSPPDWSMEDSPCAAQQDLAWLGSYLNLVNAKNSQLGQAEGIQSTNSCQQAWGAGSVGLGIAVAATGPPGWIVGAGIAVVGVVEGSRC